MVFNTVYRLEIQSVSHVGNFDPSCVLSPLYLLSQYIQTMCGVGGFGVGVLSCVVDHILQEINTLYLTRLRTYKIATPPQTKMTSIDDI
jgi:hypothetical protein